jgi:hypothetical protein
MRCQFCEAKNIDGPCIKLLPHDLRLTPGSREYVTGPTVKEFDRMLLEYAHSTALKDIAPNVWSVVKIYTREFGRISTYQFLRECLCALIAHYRHPLYIGHSEAYRKRAFNILQSNLSSGRNGSIRDEDFFGAYFLWLRPVESPEQQEMERQAVCKTFEQLDKAQVHSDFFSLFGYIAMDVVKDEILSINAVRPFAPNLIRRTSFERRRKYYEEFTKGSWPLSTPPRDSSLETARSLVEIRLLHLLNLAVQSPKDSLSLSLILVELKEPEFQDAICRIEESVNFRSCDRKFEVQTAAATVLGAHCLAIFEDILSFPKLENPSQLLNTSPRIDKLCSGYQPSAYKALSVIIQQDYFIRLVHLVASTLVFCASVPNQTEFNQDNPDDLESRNTLLAEIERELSKEPELANSLSCYRWNKSEDNFLGALRELLKVVEAEQRAEKRVAYRNEFR